MGRPSAILSSSPSLFSFLPNQLHPHSLFSKKHFRTSSSSSSLDFHLSTKLPSNFSRFAPLTLSPLQATEIQATVESIPHESECIEIGYISSVHGFKGEVRVKPTTDFPELRFSKPGRRWLKVRVSGKEMIQEVELTNGRDHPGQKCWILTFSGFDTSEKAMQLVGSTLLVRDADRPELAEGEFYTPDLVGMKVVLKETGKPVGMVVDVFSTGPNDLLQVMLNSTAKQHGQSSSESETAVSGLFAWVPFVEAIVPHVDMNQRVMLITPPKGLLELNLRADVRSKKERRYLEWKQRKKLRQRFNASKKKLIEMGQDHILQGFLFGNKAQKGLLANQIAGINFKLLQQAMQTIDKPYHRCNLTELLDANSSQLLKNVSRMSKDRLFHCGSYEDVDTNHEQYERGFNLMSKGKVAIILVMDVKKNQGSASDSDFVGCESVKCPSSILHLQELFINEDKFTKIEEWRTSVPLIIVSPVHDIQSTQELFLDHDYFGFDSEKVHFLEEEKLPVISNSLTEQDRHKLLVKSPWEILESPVGSGGVFGLLSRHRILENLNEMGIEYVEVCSLSQRSYIAHPLFVGFVDSCEADIGMTVLDDDGLDDQNFDIMFSIGFLKRITNQNMLQFYAVPQLTPHVEKVDKEWVDINVASPNSYHLHCSIYSSLNACPPDKICLLHVTD